MSLCLAVVSGKGGTGKSTVSCGLAVSFARKNKKVVLIDLDIGLRCLDMFFGIEENVVFDLYDAINENEYDKAFYYSKEYGQSICIVPAPPKDKSISAEQLSSFVDKCKAMFDVVILDLPAGLDFSILSEISSARFLCVSNPDPISLRDAFTVYEALSDNNLGKPLLIINRFNAELILNKTYKNIDDMIDLSGIKLLGIVPDSSELMLFSINHRLNKRKNAYKALDRITKRIVGETVLLPKPQKI